MTSPTHIRRRAVSLRRTSFHRFALMLLATLLVAAVSAAALAGDRETILIEVAGIDGQVHSVEKVVDRSRARRVMSAGQIQAVSYDEDLVPAVILSGGLTNGSFTVDRSNGIELGLRGKLRFNHLGDPENTFNSNGDGTYSFAAGQAPGQGAQTAVWAFEWGVNTDFDGTSGRKLADLTFEMGLDGDPGLGTDFLVFDPITPSPPAVPFFDHAIGDNNTAAGAGQTATSESEYSTLIATNNVAQNSWRYNFFLDGPLAGFDPTVDGRYTIYLEAFDAGVSVARVEIDILVGDAPASTTVRSLSATGDTPTATDNDFTRIDNAVQALASGSVIVLQGVFDWSEANALQSWEDAGWWSLLPDGVHNVTITAAAQGDAVIQGPGDLPETMLEMVFGASGSNRGLEISNLVIEDFDTAIGILDGGGGVNAYDGTTITNNRILMAEDVDDGLQNIGIHYSFGHGQTISNNLIEIPATAIGDGAGFSPSGVAIQSNTSGGAYEGLLIENNTVRVLNVQTSEHPERIVGIWENGGAHTNNIIVRGNTFESAAEGSDLAYNQHEGFRINSQSSSNSTVLYENNSATGAKIGFQWLNNSYGADFSSREPVDFRNNIASNNETGVSLESNGAGLFRNNDFSDNAVGIGNNTAIGRLSDAECNWWGSAAGPAAGYVVGNVDTQPWNQEPDGKCFGGASTRYVATGGTDGANQCLDENAPCRTIAHAIARAGAHDTVQVAAGTYAEQVVINKPLRLAGQPGAVIEAPAAPAAFEIPEAPAGTSFEPVVIAFGGTESGGHISGSDTIEVEITGFVIDGQDRISANGSIRTAGILLRNAGGEVSDNTVVDMYPSLQPGPGRQTAGILVYGDSTVDVVGNDVSGYSRGGIVINGDEGIHPSPNGTVIGNTVTGPGKDADPAPVWAPNGIQIGFGASGAIINNTISGHGHPSPDTPGGIVVYASDDVVIDGNTLFDNQASIQVAYGSGTQVTNNSVTDSDYGILLYAPAPDTVVVDNTFGNNITQLAADPGILSAEDFAAANTFNLNIALAITPGVPGSVSIDSGWDHFTANLTSDGGIPENIVLWIEVAGIADADVSAGLTLELWDSGSNSWQRFGWGGDSHYYGANRDAWFLGRGDGDIVGFPIAGGHDEDLYLRVNWPNGTYSATTSLESVDSGDGSGDPGDRIYLSQTDQVVIESTPSDLVLSLTDGLPSGSPATIENGWAHFTTTLSNNGGDVPENVVLWIEVDGIDDSHVANGWTLELWDFGDSAWRRYGWGGASHWYGANRDAWFLGRANGNIVGFPIPLGFTDTQALRVNWENGSYSATITVESLDSADGSGDPGDRIYLNQTESIVVEQFVSPALAIAPASHDFGDVGMLDAASSSFTVSNTGSSTSSLELTGVSVSGDSQFAITGSGNCASGDVLAGGDSCTVEVSFAPGAVGTFVGSLDIASDAGSESAALSGQGIVPDWADRFDGAFDEPDWQFVALDDTLQPYPPQTVRITDGDYLQINDPTAAVAMGYIPRSFGESRVAALVNADGTNTGDSPDNQIDQGVISHFIPDTLAAYTAYMRMELGYQDLVLAKVDASNFDPALIDERVRVAESSDGEWSMDRMYVVELDVVDHGGGEALLIARAFDADTGALLATVEATDTAPFGPGYAGLVAITNSTGVNGTFDTASAVSSFASASLSDDLIDFGQVAAHASSAPEMVTITNDGNADLIIDSLTLSGTDAAQFAIDNSSCADPVPAGADCTFEVTFTPDGVGARSAEVLVESNASTSPDVVVLEGEGIPAQAIVTLSDLVHTYDGDPKTVTVTTDPAGLNVVVTYDGGSVLPVVVGSYAVLATVDQPDYEGSATGTLTIEKADQTISFPAIADKPADAAPFTISASSDSGLAVSFSVASGPATVSGNQVTLVGASPGDTVTISADQSGNANWNPAPTVQQSFNITEGAAAEIQAVSSTSITGLAGQPVDAGDLPTVRVIDSQGNPVAGVTVSFSIASGGGSVAGATRVTDASGHAQVGGWTLGGDAVQTLEAAAPGLTGSPLTFTAQAEPEYNFGISIDDHRDTIEVGERNTYLVMVSNAGSSDAEAAQVEVSLPLELDAAGADWLCMATAGASCGSAIGTGDLVDTPDLPAGSSVVYVLEADVLSGPTRTIEITARVSLGAAAATDTDTTTVIITEDAIFSDRFEAATGINHARFGVARYQLGAWLEMPGGLVGGFPPSTLLRGVDAHGADVFRIRSLSFKGGHLIRLSMRDRNGSWSRSEWHESSRNETVLTVDFDAEQGSLLLVGQQLKASLSTGAAAPGVTRLIALPAVSVQLNE